MRLDLTRAQRRFLGLVGEPTPGTADLEICTHIGLAPQAEQTLFRLMATPGHAQGGPLFCTLRSTTHIEVRFAAQNGYWPWPSSSDPDPLVSDERYVLGWSDALSTLYGTRCEWRGNWLMFPNRRMPPIAESLDWVDRARAVGLVDDEHFLLVVGWHDHHLAFQGFLYDGERRATLQLRSEGWIGQPLE